MRPIFRLWVAPALLLLSVLACGTAIDDIAHFSCPTLAPPTLGIPPTALPGTLIPPPSATPIPPTPYQIRPPQDFYVGDAVYVGQVGGAVYLRFRLQNIQARPASPRAGQPRSLYLWTLEISNLGNRDYETVPVALMFITRLSTENGEVSGSWATSAAAMTAAGFTDEDYAPLTAGMTRVYHLAAYAPVGTVRQLAYTLDGIGSNRITWVNAFNPYCAAGEG